MRFPTLPLSTLPLVTSGTLVFLCAVAGTSARATGHRCPNGSVSVEGQFCIDRYEGSLVEVMPRGRTRRWNPYTPPARDAAFRAVSRRGLIPQAYVSQNVARAACLAAGRRLCTEPEWVLACRGSQRLQYPYGNEHVSGRCNDSRENPVPRVFPGSADVFHERQMNDPRLNALPDTLARAGEFARCRTRNGVFDMVGNLHEWVDATTSDGRLGVFRGGFYADARQNGRGCAYATRAHYPGYHDYSTGFRCCADVR